ncbi:hypothetical protein SE17_38475, partial [Kouleothrix aurantiaca]
TIRALGEQAATADAPPLPSNIQNALIARFDRLPLAERYMLQMAAVIGPQFDRPVLDGIAGAQDALGGALARLAVRGIVRAMLQNYQSQEVVSGASTITQQLVRNVLLPPDQRTAVSFERKLREAILAFKVSQKYSKDQILGLYLNEVYYGAQAYGVEAAAQTFFGKHVWELNLAEATLIAGLPQSPTVLNPLTNLEGAKARQKITLGLMVKFGYLTAAEARAAYSASLNFVPQQSSVVAPHFVFYVRQLLEQRYGPDVLYRGGLRVVTSLDLHWQTEAERITRARVMRSASVC